MDQIDRQILKILQENARTPLKVIAAKTFLSPPAVSARIANLQVEPPQKVTFYPFAESCPNVLDCNCATGPFSMLLKAAFASMTELDTFIGQLQEFGKPSTQIASSTHTGPRGVDPEVEN